MIDGDKQIGSLLASADGVWYPVVVLGEYRFGIMQSRLRPQYENWLATHVDPQRILPIDEGTARSYAMVRHELKLLGRPIPANDLWIAALCRQHGYDILSRDRHFDAVAGLRRISW